MALGWRGQYVRYREFFLNITALYKQRADLRAFLEVTLSIATITIFLVFALKPTTLTIISLLKEIKEKKSTIALLDQKIGDLKTANAVFTQNEALIPAVDMAIGTFAAPDVITKQVVGLGAKDTVDVLGISIGQVALIGPSQIKKNANTGVKPLPGVANEMPISISVKGSYTNLTSIIKDIENLKIPIKIDSLTINSSQLETGQVVSAIIGGRVPFLGNN